MTTLEVHKCIMSYGIFPIAKIVKELEENNMFEQCIIIRDAVNDFRNRFPAIFNDTIWTSKWSQELENQYYANFKKLTNDGELLARENMGFYLEDIKKRLKLI